MDTSYTTVVAMLDAASHEEITKEKGSRERHSISVTPSMLSEDASLPRRDRTHGGICIQRGRGATRQDSDQFNDDSLENSIHHHRRNAMRSVQGGISRRHSSPASALTIVRPASSPVLSPLSLSHHPHAHTHTDRQEASQHLTFARTQSTNEEETLLMTKLKELASSFKSAPS